MIHFEDSYQLPEGFERWDAFKKSFIYEFNFDYNLSNKERNELKKWLQENCHKSVYMNINEWHPSLWFEDQNDLILFKLGWI